MPRLRKTAGAEGEPPERVDLGSIAEEPSEDQGDVPSERGSATFGTETAPRKRRRRRAPAARLDPDGVATLLFSIHLGLATVLASPEVALDKGEAARLAEASVEVAAHYDIAMLSPKVLAWINLGLVAAGIYGPRVLAWRLRHSMRGGLEAGGT